MPHQLFHLVSYTYNPGPSDFTYIPRLIYDQYFAGESQLLSRERPVSKYAQSELGGPYVAFLTNDDTTIYGDFMRMFHFDYYELIPIFYWSLIFTVIRYFFELFLCQPLLNNLKLDSKSNRDKFPESFWKFTIYSFLWAYTSYLLLFTEKHDYFLNPYEIWHDWRVGMFVPYEVRLVYFIQCGFYLHSLYATFYMDAVRKDFLIMVIHHVLTIVLLLFSYGTRYHKIGLMVLFVHDVTDIFLEFSKCNVYLKHRNGQVYNYHEHIANVSVVTFAVCWFVFRLYWFPIKVLYTSGVVSIHVLGPRGGGLWEFFNYLLWTLLALDLYWFYFILLFVYKIAMGQMKEMTDTRELEDEDQNEIASKED